jgi:hypothetical protein
MQRTVQADLEGRPLHEIKNTQADLKVGLYDDSGRCERLHWRMWPRR